jgi:DNA-binding LacI/PurR family transcriptional regulator
LTRLKQPFDQLGNELVSLLCQRIEQKNISLPGRIVPTVFMGGGTTRPEENEILGIGDSR